MKKRCAVLVIFLFLVTLVACATPEGGPAGKGDQKAGRGFSLALKGIAQLVLSPFQIYAGLLEGIASIPYYLSTSLQDINKGMIDTQVKITLDDTYESAYGKRISAVPASGDTGEVFRRMKHATEYFQKVLSQYGVPNADHYILASIDTA
ncbi:MAG: hypothetical protein Q8P12_00490, partial [bacterium]|nr:hypothetical protein [bacterium]